MKKEIKKGSNLFKEVESFTNLRLEKVEIEKINSLEYKVLVVPETKVNHIKVSFEIVESL